MLLKKEEFSLSLCAHVILITIIKKLNTCFVYYLNTYKVGQYLQLY